MNEVDALFQRLAARLDSGEYSVEAAMRKIELASTRNMKRAVGVSMLKDFATSTKLVHKLCPHSDESKATKERMIVFLGEVTQAVEAALK